VRGAWIAIAVALLGAPAQGEPGVDEVLACMRKNAPRTALVQSVELVAKDRAGQERAQRARLFAKRGEDGRGRLLIRIEDPPDLRGSAFLLLQKEKGSDMFVYLPELKKVRRVSSRNLRGKLFGTDFSYEDVEQLFAQGEHTALRRLPDAEHDSRPVFALEAVPAPDAGSAYQRVASLVDRATCVPLEISFYGKGEAPVKQISVDAARITKEGEVHVPRLVVARDLERGTESRLETLEVRVDPELPDRTFSSTALELR
jgi:hypothetical protein